MELCEQLKEPKTMQLKCLKCDAQLGFSLSGANVPNADPNGRSVLGFHSSRHHEYYWGELAREQARDFLAAAGRGKL